MFYYGGAPPAKTAMVVHAIHPFVEVPGFHFIFFIFFAFNLNDPVPSIV
jgi:hypothetical protein